MGMIIRQLGPTDRASVEAFCGAHLTNTAKAVPAHDAALSLAIRENEQILALALAQRGGPGQPASVVLIAPPAQQQLVPSLVDKALLKLASARLHKCRITFADGSEPNDLWRASRLGATA
jgi:hypothetical protein